MTKNNKILLAEDDELIRKIIHEVVKDEYELIIADNGEDAIEKAKLHEPELILLDFMMPVKNGFMVCKELRTIKELRKSIIIMVTALSDKDSERMGLSSGADDFITKPFNPIELRTKIKMMFRLRNRLLKN